MVKGFTKEDRINIKKLATIEKWRDAFVKKHKAILEKIALLNIHSDSYNFDVTVNDKGVQFKVTTYDFKVYPGILWKK